MIDRIANNANFLRQHYACLKLRDFHLRPCDGANVNSSNYFLQLEHQSASPKFVVKVEQVSTDERYRRRLQALNIQNQLAARSQLVPEVISTNRGELAIPSGDYLVSMTVYVSGTVGTDDLTSSIQAARGLACLQRDLRWISGEIQRCQKYQCLSDAELARVIKQPSPADLPLEFVRGVSQFVSQLLPECYAFMRDIESRSKLPRQLVHCDFHPRNTLFSKKQLVAILDYDSLITDYRMQSISFASSRFSPVGHDWHFLSAYHQVDPLTAEEIRLFPAFVLREAVQRVNWLVRTNYFDQQPLWQSEISKHLNWIQRMLQLDQTFRTLKDDAIFGRLSETIRPQVADRAKSA
jgi:Ser/Thr protein kinase RdoA (MazF antagonist)